MNDSHLLVVLGEDRYALAVEQVREVLRSSALTPVPGSPPTVLGVLNLRGEILPALDASALLASAPVEQADAIVVVETAGNRAGLAVDRVIDIISVPLGLEPSDDERLAGSALIDGVLVGIVDVRRLLEGVGAGAPA